MNPSLKIPDWTSDYFIANQSACNQMLEDLNMLNNIPLLNSAPLHEFKDRQLIRFRGMVQDMHNPEYYFQQYEVKNMQTGASEIKCGMYTDSACCLPHEEILLESQHNQNSERYTCIVISTPGLNNWVKKENVCLHNVGTKIICNSSQKRNLEEDKCEDMDCSEPIKKKEKILHEGSESMDIIAEQNTEERNIFSKEHILNFPIPTDDGKACIVKLYQEVSLKLNEVVEIIGFISLDPFLSTVCTSEEMMSDAEVNTHHPPASLVPRLHAIKVNDLSMYNIKSSEIIPRAHAIRNDLHLVLSQLLFGDHLAADYLICHLLSSIYLRRDYLCLGNYPLNITKFPAHKYKTFAKDFYKFLTQLVKKSHLLQVTLENLNDLALLPKKDYECNRLTSGVLQLSNNTHLILDETELTAGQVSQAGRENYNTLCDLVSFQRVTYDFKFYKIGYETDIPILIFSESKSFIPCQTQVILKIDSESENHYLQVIEIANQYLKNENRLEDIRQYLEILRDTKFEIDDDIVNIIQEDFVQIRQAHKNVSVDDLHALMILARFLSLSYGSSTLTLEYWKKAVQMEMERLNRLPQKK